LDFKVFYDKKSEKLDTSAGAERRIGSGNAISEKCFLTLLFLTSCSSAELVSASKGKTKVYRNFVVSK